MNYDEMSDKELSARVWCKSKGFDYIKSSSSEHGVFTVSYREGNNPLEVISADFSVNRWSTMGPIIDHHKITVMYRNKGWCAASNVSIENICLSPCGSRGDVSDFSCDFIINDNSPLRAAAICYLEMG